MRGLEIWEREEGYKLGNWGLGSLETLEGLERDVFVDLGSGKWSGNEGTMKAFDEL